MELPNMHMDNQNNLRDTQKAALVQLGVSQTLVAMLDGVAEATAGGGQARYSTRSLHELRRRIFCRQFNHTLWEWAHFAAIVSRLNDGDFYAWLMADQTPTGATLAQALQQQAISGIEIHEGGIRLSLENREFKLHLNRTNFLASLSEFLLNVDFLALDHALVSLSAAPELPSAKAIDDVASGLQKAIESFLNDHLRDARYQQEASQWIDWLEANPTCAQDGLPNDDGVFEFWVQNWGGDVGDFKRYSSVVRSAMTFTQANLQGLVALSMAESASLEDVMEQGSDRALEALCVLGGALDISAVLDTLESKPLADIKFLTAADARTFRQYAWDALALKRLSLSVLRAQLFGSRQAMITGDLQNSGGKNIATLVTCGNVLPPEPFVESLRKLAAKLDDTRAATAHVLLQKDESEARQALGDSALARAKRAWSGVSRQGFKELPDQNQSDPFELAQPLLEQLAIHLNSVITQFDLTIAQHYSSPESCERERRQFAAQFELIYGVNA